MSRRSRRYHAARGARPLDHPASGFPVARELEDRELEDRRRRFLEDRELEDRRRRFLEEDLVADSITTRFIDSPPIPRPRIEGRSPWLNVRASLRSRWEPGRRLARIIEAPKLMERALACAKRSVRREVLFALRRSGKGAGARRRRRSEDSKHRC